MNLPLTNYKIYREYNLTKNTTIYMLPNFIVK
jgi:hypothetical protein